MLSACGHTGGDSAPATAAVPDQYQAGCADPAIAAGALTKLNGDAIANAFGQCKRLQADTATWAGCYLADLGNRPLPAACTAPKR